MPTIIDLIRHGEPVGGRKYRGQLDDPLSATGWRQMRDAVGGHVPWDAIISSPLRRCAEFARELARCQGLALIEDGRLAEIGFGEWEGQSAAELLAHNPDILLRFWRDPVNNTPPGAESLTAFRERVLAAWRDLIEVHAGKHVLVVGHAGVVRMVLHHVLGTPLDRLFRIDVANAGITRVRVEGDGAQALPVLVFHGAAL